MFNPEKLLGGLIRSGMRRKKGLGSLVSGGAALGLAGIAMEAIEHYMNRPQSTPPSPPAPPPAAPSSGAGATKGPPPPASVQSPPPPPNGSPAPQRREEAILLIRAMIAAANADGAIDARERALILEKLKGLRLTEEENRFILHELLQPKPMRDIVHTVATPEMARQVYLVSLMAISVDTAAEQEYLQRLAQELRLDAEALTQIHRQAGTE